MSLSGTYECVVKSPLGDQKSTIVVNVDGDSWTGTNSGAQGSAEITDGKVDGNTITWSMKAPRRLRATMSLAPSRQALLAPSRSRASASAKPALQS
jgi:hypothetical protein